MSSPVRPAAVVRLGHHAPLFLDEQDDAENIGLRVEPVEAVHEALDRLLLLMMGERRLAPILTPFATARSRPSPVRARINSRSNSASPSSTVSIRRPYAVVVSAHVSLRERKPALGGDRRQCVQKIAGRAGQPVKARQRQHLRFFQAGR
jgi:hypothetical protein